MTSEQRCVCGPCARKVRSYTGWTICEMPRKYHGEGKINHTWQGDSAPDCPVEGHAPQPTGIGVSDAELAENLFTRWQPRLRLKDKEPFTRDVALLLAEARDVGESEMARRQAVAALRVVRQRMGALIQVMIHDGYSPQTNEYLQAAIASNLTTLQVAEQKDEDYAAPQPASAPADVLGLLRELEYVPCPDGVGDPDGCPYGAYCHICRMHKGFPHKPDCRLKAALEAEDSLTVLSIEAPLKRLRERIAEYGTQKATAEAAGVSPSYLNDVLHGARTPSGKLLDWLGFLEFGGYVDADEHAARIRQAVNGETR